MNNWKTMVYGYDLPTAILANGAFQGDKGIYEWFVVSYGSLFKPDSVGTVTVYDIQAEIFQIFFPIQTYIQ